MAQEEVKAPRKKMTKGKKWFTVYAPKVFNEVEVGECLGAGNSELIGRVISAPYAQISGELSKYYIKLSLKIVKSEGDKAYTEIVGYELAKPYLQRVIRRRSSKVDDFIDVKMGDKNVRIKYLAVTAYISNASQRASLRHAMKNEMHNYVKDKDLDKVVVDFGQGRVQKEMLKVIKVIFPVRFFDIRRIELLSGKKVKADFGSMKVFNVTKRASRKEGKKISFEGENAEQKGQLSEQELEMKEEAEVGKKGNPRKEEEPVAVTEKEEGAAEELGREEAEKEEDEAVGDEHDAEIEESDEEESGEEHDAEEESGEE